MTTRSRPDPGGRRRRLVLVTPGFSAADDDWCIPILRDFVAGLAERNEVAIVALRYPGSCRRYRTAGADVVALGGGGRRGLAKVALMARAVAAVAGEARRRSADVIHALWAHEPGAVACLAGRLTGVPVVVTLMGGELAALPAIGYGGMLTLGNRTLARASLARADRVVALSGFVLDVAAGSVGAARLRRLDFGVPTDRFRPGPEPRPAGSGRRIRFLCVGSLVPVKGHEMLLRAFAGCLRELPESRLELVGAGELAADLERLALDLGVASAVCFTGPVDHSRLPELYRQADVLVVSSWWEGASQVALEAAACGLPIVGTAVGVLPDLTGAVRCVAVGDAAALAREMARVGADAELRRTMAAAAVTAAPALDDGIADHERLYDAVRRGPPAPTERGRDG